MELETKQSQSTVPMAAELAQVLRERQKTMAYGNPTDGVFASLKTHERTLQELLRHAKVDTTLGLYSQAIDTAKLEAQEEIAVAIRSSAAAD